MKAIRLRNIESRMFIELKWKIYSSTMLQIRCWIAMKMLAYIITAILLTSYTLAAPKMWNGWLLDS